MSREDSPLVDLQCEAHTYPDGTVGMHDVDFSVSPDEVVALVGGNGAGKSTLLEHLNATLVPDDGELVVDGTSITEDNKAHARKEVGFVFQDADTQLVAPTVLDDVMFGFQNHGVPGDETRERAREALAGVLTLGLLGLGTFPTLFIYRTIVQSINATYRQRLHRALGVAFLFLGLVPIAHSLALFGIQVSHIEPPIYQPLGG